MEVKDDDIKRAIREFLVENWASFQNSAKEQGLSEVFVDGEELDIQVDDILLS